MAGSATYGSTFKATLASANGPKQKNSCNPISAFISASAGVRTCQHQFKPKIMLAIVFFNRNRIEPLGEFLMRIGRRNLVSGAALRSGIVPARSATRCSTSTVSRSFSHSY